MNKIINTKPPELILHEVSAEFSRQLHRIAEAKAIIKSLLILMPHPHCCELYHDKKDYHSVLEDCPVQKRILQKIEEAQKFLIDS